MTKEDDVAPDPTNRRLSLRQYAQYRKDLGLPGSVLSTIQAAVSDGRISRSCSKHDKCPKGCRAGRIDPFAADIEWERSTNHARSQMEHRSMSMSEAQTRRAAAEARIKEIELEEMEGHLVPADRVREEHMILGKKVQDLMMAIPSRVSGEFANETSAKKISRRLSDEIRQALTVLDYDPIDE
jgi:hypothetical protein